MPPRPAEIEFRELAESDLPLMQEWLARPHVKRWYQPRSMSLADVEDRYLPFIRKEVPTSSHIGQVDGEPAGYLQCYRVADWPDWAALADIDDGISVDLLIGPERFLHRGLGRTILAAYLQLAFGLYPRERTCWIAHAEDNAGAIACSRAVGFQYVRTFVEKDTSMKLMCLDWSQR